MTAVTEDPREATYLFECQCLSNGVMRSPSTTLSPPSNAVVALLA